MGELMGKIHGMKKALKNQWLVSSIGGSGEIRTHERLTPSAVFKTAAFNHSATLPMAQHYTEFNPLMGNRASSHGIAALAEHGRLRRAA